VNSSFTRWIFIVPLNLLRAGCLVLFAAATIAKAETITVDFSSDQGPVTYRASGFLHGMNGTKPGASLVDLIKPHMFRFGWSWSTAAYSRAKSLGADVQLVLSDLIGYSSVPDPMKWQNLCTTWATNAKNNGWVLQWDIWNEPNGAYFWRGTQEQFFETWRLCFLRIRAVDPNAVIVGPSIDGFDAGYLQSFLSYARANNVLPNILSWHEFGGAGPIEGNVQYMRSYMASNGFNISRISINEVIHPGEYTNPGATARTIASLERARVDSAAHACWGDTGGSNCNNNSLDGILTFDNTQPRSAWWAYRGYANITGRIVRLSPGGTVDGVAGQDSGLQTASVVLGREGASGDVLVNFTRISSAAYLNNAGQVRVVAKRIPDSGSSSLSGPTTVVDADYAVSNDSVSVTLPDFGYSDAYIIKLSRGRVARQRLRPEGRENEKI